MNNRITKAIQFIDHHYINDVTPELIAREVCCSVNHLRKIFKQYTGESIVSYIKRLRLQRAAHYLIYTNLSMSELSLASRFENQESFSRSFKRLYNLSPRDFRKKYFLKVKGTIENVNDGQIAHIENYENPLHIKLQTEPARMVACLRHFGTYDTIPQAYINLLNWANAQNLIKSDTQLITVCYDDKLFTPREKIRLDLCLTIDDEIVAGQKIYTKKIMGGLFAKLHHKGSIEEHMRKWNAFAQWLPISGYSFRDYCAYDVYHFPHEVLKEPLQFLNYLQSGIEVTQMYPVKLENYLEI